MSPEQRFWAKVNIPDNPTDLDCFEWVGAKRRGYGAFRVDDRLATAHRFAWELANGPIPEGLEVNHLCHNKACVRVEHLQLLSKADHRRYTADHQPRDRFCARGHDIGKVGRASNRGCKECERIDAHARYVRNKDGQDE